MIIYKLKGDKMDNRIKLTRRGGDNNCRPLTFLPNLFNKPKGGYPPLDINDKFVSPELLKDRLSLFASNSEGVPNYIYNMPDVDDIIDFSEQEWQEINEVQLKRENEEREAEDLEEQQRKKKEAADNQIKATLDRKVDRIFQKHMMFIRKACPVMIPYKSRLNHEEHKAYLRAFVKFRIRTPKTAIEQVEYENFLRLQNRVYEEQKDFMGFSYQVSRLQLKAYNEVPESMNNFVNEYVLKRRKDALRYKRYYVQEQPVPICPQDPTNRFSDLYFNHAGHLLSLGSVPWIRLPNPHTICKLPVDDIVNKKINGSTDEPVDDANHLHKTPVSADPNAVYLSKKHQANIVISASALKVIADNRGPNFDKEWDIPVIVRTYQINDPLGNCSSHRVVFIDKPMPRKVWTPSEKKKHFYKKSAQLAMTEVKRQLFFKLKSPMQFGYAKLGSVIKDTMSEEKIAAEYDEDVFDLYSSADHDIFGPSSPSKKRKLQIKNIKQKVTASDSKSKCVESESASDIDNKMLDENVQKRICKGKDKNMEGRESAINLQNTRQKVVVSTENADIRPSTSKDTFSVLDNLLDMQDNLLKPSTYDDSPKKLEQNRNEVKKKFVWPWSDTVDTDWDDHIEPKGCKIWTGDNVHYQLFTMGFNNTKPYSSTQPLRVLIRSNVHGLSRFKGPNSDSRAFVIHPKPEYQAYFGCEVNTISEITQQWVELLVRPNASLLEVRVCESSGEVLKSEQKNLATVLKDGKQPHIGFAPQQPLSTIYAVFNALSALSTGDYLLKHDVKTEAFIKLMKAVDSNNDAGLQTFDLHAAYSSASAHTRTHVTPPWLAIDTHILTPFHLKHYKIPGTFPMDNPTKKLTKREKKKIHEKAKLKKKLEELNKADENLDEKNYL